MGELEERLIKKALQKHKKIFPCSRKGTFDACFTKENGRLLFWYNTKDKSTHVISAKVLSAKRVSRRKSASTTAK